MITVHRIGVTPEGDQRPFEWDLKRLLVSLALMVCERLLYGSQCHQMLRRVARHYFKTILQLVQMPRMQMWRMRVIRYPDALPPGPVPGLNGSA